MKATFDRQDPESTFIRLSHENCFNLTFSDNPRCSYYDANLLPHGGPEPDRKRRSLSDEFDRYDRSNPLKGAKQITTGFRKWAARYIAACNGQKAYQHHVKRFPKIYNRMVGALKEQATAVQFAEWELTMNA